MDALRAAPTTIETRVDVADSDAAGAAKRPETARLEIMVHRPTRAMARETREFLRGAVADERERERSVAAAEEKCGDRPRRGPRDADEVLIVTTCQPTEVPLTAWGEREDREKDRLLRTFVAFAERACDALRERGYWADFADPASGLLVRSGGQARWPEVQGLERLRGYRLAMAGRCHVVEHPRWGFKHYPATMFTDAPEDVLASVLLDGARLV